VNALYPDIQTDRLAESRDWYCDLLSLEVVFDSEWFVMLADPDNPALKIAFVAHDHETVVSGFRRRADGLLVTIEVDDVDAVHAHARRLGCDIRLSLRSEPFGQRHFIAIDPNGLQVDVMSLIPFAPDFAEAHQDAFGPALIQEDH
jgi:catechol 2,3-dioxygenase-like lactoylglutathione lyase family enzyme